jgi:hypothetical protein
MHVANKKRYSHTLTTLNPPYAIFSSVCERKRDSGRTAGFDRERAAKDSRLPIAFGVDTVTDEEEEDLANCAVDERKAADNPMGRGDKEMVEAAVVVMVDVVVVVVRESAHCGT